jgi:hypothetical protein
MWYVPITLHVAYSTTWLLFWKTVTCLTESVFVFLLFFSKSNLIDAICFAFGENALQLRAKQLEDLLHGNVIGRSRSGHSCSVMLVFDDRAKNDSEASNAGESHVFGKQSVYVRFAIRQTIRPSYAPRTYTRGMGA